MLDIGWSELLVVGIIALLVVGPKELPGLLRTIGRYVGIVRRQADEFRAQFDDAIKDTEFDEIRKEFDTIRSDTQSAVRDVETSGSVDADAEMTRKIGDPQHKPNFTNDDLKWMNGQDVPSPAQKAAAAASVSASAAASASAAKPQTETRPAQAKADAQSPGGAVPAPSKTQAANTSSDTVAVSSGDTDTGIAKPARAGAEV